MIVRLKIKGFKNLKEVDLSFGSFTCIAGENGVGKSNLFDAIRFLSHLASKTLVEAALAVRESTANKHTAVDIQNLFYHNGENYVDRIEIAVDMITAQRAIDHLGQLAEAATTALHYELVLVYRNSNDNPSQNPIQIVKEVLKPIKKSEIVQQLKKIGANKVWIDSVVLGKRQNSTPFIDTNIEGNQVFIHADQQKGNKKTLILDQLPRTILSTANAENPTMVVAKQEMESWQLLQLEPAMLRSPDNISYTETRKIQINGSHLPATLYRLSYHNDIDIKSQIANRLSELIDDVFTIDVDKDEKRDLLTLIVKSKKGTPMSARFLSDGTLRFLALSVIEADPETQGIICLEEPENGIHPTRIPAMLQLIRDIACDTDLPTDNNNPLRQVIINTHSPIVVAELPEDSLLLAKLSSDKSIKFVPLSNTWRNTTDNITKAELLRYLNPYIHYPPTNAPETQQTTSTK